jgi:hypothetical protein
MNMNLDLIFSFFLDLYNSIPENYKFLIDLSIYIVFITLYAVFIWKFYKFVSARDFLGLDLNQYNKSKHPTLSRLFGFIFYIIEYLFILPFLILSWFIMFSLFLLILNKANEIDIQQLLLISAAIVTSIRITSYSNESLSKEIAKIFPFTILVIFILQPGFFNIEGMFNGIFKIPDYADYIFILTIFIICVEFILRIFFSINQLLSFKEPEEIKLEIKKTKNSKVIPNK